MVALLTPMRPSDVAPCIMVTSVPCSKVLNGLCKLILSCWPSRSRLASNNLIRASNKTILVPLSAAASFPAFAANIAELTPAFTTFHSQFV